MRTTYLGLLALLVACGPAEQSQPAAKHMETEVLVVGGGAAGTMAGIAAARQGVTATIVEKHPWLGGMLTSAGVSAIDGNHKLPAGLWGEFRDSLRARYGGAEAVETGWVSNTLFEPHVGAAVLANMAQAEEKLQVLHGYQFLDLVGSPEHIASARFLGQEGDTLTVQAELFIDATELGDVMAASGASYFMGQDPRSRTGEALAPEQATDVIQDLTYVAILKDYGPGQDKTIDKPQGYDPEVFRCSCAELCDSDSVTVTCEQMMTYGALPNGKVMLNWPRRGNDYYLNLLQLTPQQREEALAAAKLHTLRYVYFIQTELGLQQWGLADDEFPTEDGLALMPYHRESRRLNAMQFLTLDDIAQRYTDPDSLFMYGIAVGDYPVDHHRQVGPQPEHIPFPAIPSYSIPYGSLVPREVDNLLVTEKSIGVSSLANGTTRLQPVVMQLGQAAGTAAALAVLQDRPPSELNVRHLQAVLLEADMWVAPAVDTQPADEEFVALQKAIAMGLLPLEGKPEAWANRSYVYPDSAVSVTELRTIEQQLGKDFAEEWHQRAADGQLTRRQLAQTLRLSGMLFSEPLRLQP